MADQNANTQESFARLQADVSEILRGLRVSELPYPVGSAKESAAADWLPMLHEAWRTQSDKSVLDLIDADHRVWATHQVNSAYLADGIMDRFLNISGLHPTLVQRAARLRFFLAWRLDVMKAAAFEGGLQVFLDSLSDWRGWSDNGGRSARVLLDSFDKLVAVINECFESLEYAPFTDWVARWEEEGKTRLERTRKLHDRLTETENGAARQRAAEQQARALVGQSLERRHLPPELREFIINIWQPLIREALLQEDEKAQRHTRRCLEWLVWVGDPQLAGQNHERLYQVGEVFEDQLLAVMETVTGKKPDSIAVSPLKNVLVSRLRGEDVPVLPAALSPSEGEWDPAWLELKAPPQSEADAVCGTWFVEGEGSQELRRFCLTILPETHELLWTNGYGVRIGLQHWSVFEQQRSQGILRPLPSLTYFGEVVERSVQSLRQALDEQRRRRAEASAAAEARAEKLAADRKAAEEERQRRIAEQQRAAEIEAKRLAEENRRIEAESAAQAEADRLEREQALRLEAQQQLNTVQLGSWIVVQRDDEAGGNLRLKLAVRINASRKLVFVDRHGLNRKEFIEDELIELIVKGTVRVLGQSAEFDDTLSRVVGRIRVGR